MDLPEQVHRLRQATVHMDFEPDPQRQMHHDALATLLRDSGIFRPAAPIRRRNAREGIDDGARAALPKLKVDGSASDGSGADSLNS